MIEEKLIYAYALKNAIAHNGKAIVGAVVSGLFAEGLKKEQMKEYGRKISEIVDSVNKLGLEKQKIEFINYEEFISCRQVRDISQLPDLKDVPKDGVIMRFSPSSSASNFHIGHILTGLPTSIYADKYGGKFYLRIEDTNPEKTVPECYESFPKEAKWIFGNVTEYYAQSDRMDKYYKFIEELISKGFAFVCTCKKSDEDFKTQITKNPCNCRKNSIKDNLKKWNKMLHKEGFKEREAIVRFKTFTQFNNPALLDFPLARINESPHPRQKNKYRVWPLMNLCVAYDDIDQKCTHIIRGNEHRDNAIRQEMIFDSLGVKKPLTYFMGRYKFTDLEISKTKIAERIKRGEFSDWNDIRLPLAKNFKKRGYQPEAFKSMVAQRGLSNVDKVMSQSDFFQVLNNFNREIIKPLAIPLEVSKDESINFGNRYILLMDNAMKQEIFTKDKLENEKIYFIKNIGFAKLNEDVLWFGHD